MVILGRLFDIRETTNEDMCRKEAAAWAQFKRIRHILRHKTSLQHRLRILQSCVLQKILWGCESWVFTKRRLQHLRGLDTKMLLSMLPCPGALQGLEPRERILEHSRYVRRVLGEKGFLLLDELAARKYWSWCGHLARLPQEQIAAQWARFRDVRWWRGEQAKPDGMRHFHTDAAISRWEGPLIRYCPQKERWKEAARHREDWKKGFETFWANLNAVQKRRSPRPAVFVPQEDTNLQLEDSPPLGPLHLPLPERTPNRPRANVPQPRLRERVSVNRCGQDHGGDKGAEIRSGRKRSRAKLQKANAEQRAGD